MIFADVYNQKWNRIEDECERLVYLASKNQTHEGDLLLVYLNAQYDKEVLKWNISGKNFEPFLIGNTTDKISGDLHYKFINNYRETAIYKDTLKEYKNSLIYAPSKEVEIEFLQENEGITIQLEMLIYLKIWEADSLIRRFYQVARLIHQEPYDWFFSLPEEPNDKNATGTRQEIIRKKIRDRLELKFPNIYASIKAAYVPQIRNSIAHSNYSFLGRNIHLNNIDKHSNLKVLSFDDWIEKFHETLAFYNGYIKMVNEIYKIYSCKAEFDKVIQVRRIEKREIEKINFRSLVFDEERRIWNFKQD